MVLADIFWVFLKIALIAFGGGPSFLPLIEREVVQGRNWLGEAEFLEVTGMAQIFPGALSIKFATYTGYKVAGIGGAVVANLGNLLPAVVFMMLAMLLYSKYKDVAGSFKKAFRAKNVYILTFKNGIKMNANTIAAIMK